MPPHKRYLSNNDYSLLNQKINNLEFKLNKLIKILEEKITTCNKRVDSLEIDIITNKNQDLKKVMNEETIKQNSKINLKPLIIDKKPTNDVINYVEKKDNYYNKFLYNMIKIHDTKPYIYKRDSIIVLNRHIENYNNNINLYGKQAYYFYQFLIDQRFLNVKAEAISVHNFERSHKHNKNIRNEINSYYFNK